MDQYCSEDPVLLSTGNKDFKFHRTMGGWQPDINFHVTEIKIPTLGQPGHMHVLLQQCNAQPAEVNFG
jgi:hypothetical protein